MKDCLAATPINNLTAPSTAVWQQDEVLEREARGGERSHPELPTAFFAMMLRANGQV